jgi:hypothetical protein
MLSLCQDYYAPTPDVLLSHASGWPKRQVRAIERQLCHLWPKERDGIRYRSLVLLGFWASRRLKMALVPTALMARSPAGAPAGEQRAGSASIGHTCGIRAEGT